MKIYEKNMNTKVYNCSCNQYLKLFFCINAFISLFYTFYKFYPPPKKLDSLPPVSPFYQDSFKKLKPFTKLPRRSSNYTILRSKMTVKKVEDWISCPPALTSSSIWSMVVTETA